MANERRKRLEQSSIIRRDAPDLRSLADSLIEDETPERVVEKVITVVDPNALIPQADGSYIYKRFTITPVGMTIPTDITAAEWQEVGQVIRGLETSIQWIVGDWAIFGAERVDEWIPDNAVEIPDFDTKYAQLLAATGYSYQTLRDYAWVAGSVPVSIRNRHVSHSHHRLVAALKDENGYPLVEQQQEWLDKAEKNGWTVERLKAEMAGRPPALSRSQPSLIEKLTHDALQSRQRAEKAAKRFSRGGERQLLRQLAEEQRQWWDQFARSLEDNS